MSQNKAENKKILISKTGRFSDNIKIILFALAGIYLLYNSYHEYVTQGTLQTILASLLMGLLSLFAVNYRRLNYISRIGVVREKHSWFGCHRDVLRWTDIKFITLIYETEVIKAYFEDGTQGCKVLFDKSQDRELKNALSELAPGIEINKIQK